MDKAVEAALHTWDTYRAQNTGLQMEAAITAADEARAVTDEEVCKVLAAAFVGHPDYTTKGALVLVSAIHTAGFKVIRGGSKSQSLTLQVLLDERRRLRAKIAAKDVQIAALLKVREAAETSGHAKVCQDLSDALTAYAAWEDANAKL